MDEKSIYKKVANYKELHVYQKAEVLVLLTDVFCRRFLPAYGDRTVDQMNQAARSGKQNIVEGSEAAMTSTETEVKLVNVGRASFQELREDYEDYLKRQHLQLWTQNHPRYDRMLQFCRNENHWDAYSQLAENLQAEAFCNMALTLCHITDKMLDSYLRHLEKTFREQGGIKERMHAVRTGYRQQQDNRLQFLEQENRQLKAEIVQLKAQLAQMARKLQQQGQPL
ncbi:MAG: four helix bundle suffix domain-containing protein [Prevotella sp.]|nr:four helix bundle suffix domain-containing protein [Prevotella sp.]